jgi:hypothetical protein
VSAVASARPREERDVAIDGRRLVEQANESERGERDLYESPAVRVVAALIVLVPLGAVLALAYVVGVWEFGDQLGDIAGGLVGVVSALATVGFLWLWRKRRH